MAGLDWAYDLTPLNIEPIQAEGIGYVTHPYANKRSQPWPPKWEEDFGFAAARYPIIETDIGFMRSQGTAMAYLFWTADCQIFEFSNGISWTAWCYYP